MPFEPSSDPCNIDDMCRIDPDNGTSCSSIPKEICNQHYFIGGDSGDRGGHTKVVKCALNANGNSCVNASQCKTNNPNWFNLQPRYSFNTQGDQGSIIPENKNNICNSVSLPPDTCENGIDGYYYDFDHSPQAEPTSQCEWRNYHGHWARRFSRISIPSDVEERNQLVCSDDNLNDPAYRIFQGFSLPQAPPILKVRCKHNDSNTSPSNEDKKKDFHNEYDGSLNLSFSMIAGIIFIFILFIFIAGLLL